MKKILLSIAVFASSNDIFSQTTITPMLEIGKKWSSYSYSSNRSTQPTTSISRITSMLVADTLINNVSYIILTKNDVQKSGNGYNRSEDELSTISDIRYKLYLRQDGNSIYYKVAPNETLDKILYQFTGIEIGDTIKTEYSPSARYFTNSHTFGVIKKVDTINLNGKDVRRFLLDEQGIAKNYFFEGIGSSGAGIFPEFAFAFESLQTLECYQVNDFIVSYNYYNSIFDNSNSRCNQILTVDDINKVENTVLVKRLNDNQLQINISNSNGFYEGNIYDSNGKKVAIHSSSKGDIVDISNLKTGLYILKVSFKNGSIHTTKIVK